VAVRKSEESLLLPTVSAQLQWRGAVKLRYLTPILYSGGRRESPAPGQVSVAADARTGLRIAAAALRKRCSRSLAAALPFLLLPFFALMTIVTAWDLGFLAVVSLLAPVAYFAGYAMRSGSRGERAAALRMRRIEIDVRRRLEDVDPADSMFSLNYFEARLDQEIKRCRRHEIPLCVLTLKLPSGAKGWSSETAHLVSIASRLLRAEDSICHMGGSGYAISLPHTTPAGAAVVISRLSQELRDDSPEFGLAYLPPGRLVSSPALIEHALRTPVRADTAEAASAGVAGREIEAA
jgi:GGDEF domain-containing protein